MLIRFELLRPDAPGLRRRATYLTLVGMHGTMMMGMMTSGILGPFANYFVPLMIGARRMAFPRIEALTFWLLMAAGVILTTTIFFGGFPTGWTGYAPLNDQANTGDGLRTSSSSRSSGISMTLLGLNMIATIMTMRAPGLTWTRLPIFVLGRALHVGPDGARRAGADRDALDGDARPHGADRPSSSPSGGGSPYLYENLFWVFGHPEVYILALPGFGDRARAAARCSRASRSGATGSRSPGCSA